MWLSGCYGLPLSTFELGPYASAVALETLAEDEGTNYYEPIVLSSNEVRIQIKYLTVNSNAMHEEVVELIKDHCDGSYNETSRQVREGWTTVDAECTKNTDN